MMLKSDLNIPILFFFFLADIKNSIQSISAHYGDYTRAPLDLKHSICTKYLLLCGVTTVCMYIHPAGGNVVVLNMHMLLMRLISYST